MSDIRWVDVESDIEDALLHFRNAIELDRDQLSGTGLKSFYVASMAFMHAMQCGHSSSERAFTRILDIIGEHRPEGSAWHETLLNQLSLPIENEVRRPALLSAALAGALHETRRFRHRAVHAYSDFAFAFAAPALTAASVVIDRLPGEIEAFRLKVDPD